MHGLGNKVSRYDSVQKHLENKASVNETLIEAKFLWLQRNILQLTVGVERS